MFKLFGGQSKAEPDYEAILTARLNARVQPIDRGEYFEDPLDDVLRTKGIGKVLGGGTQLCDAPDGIEFVDVEVGVSDASDATLNEVIAALENAGAPRGSKLIIEGDGRELPFGKLEGMALFLNGTDLPEEVYANSDVNDIIAKCDELLAGIGQFRGYWEGPQETALYFYGTTFEAMNAAVKGYLDENPACEKTRVVKIA